MEISFSGKIALVTGAGKGIGEGITVALAKGGAKVFALSRTQSDLDQLEKQVAGITGICVDLSNWTETKQIVKKLGPIDLLVNNAGVALLTDLFNVTEQDFDKTLDVNTKAAVNVSQVVAQSLIDRGVPGNIVNVSSISSMIGLPEQLSYAASKGALDQITRVMALELGPKQIRVNSVNPTVVLTAMGRKAWSDPEKSSKMIARTPQGKFAEVKDVVHAVLFLLSDKSDMINGVILPVDGGLTAV